MVNPLACVKSQRSLYNRFNFIFAQLYGISYQLSFNYILFPRSEKNPNRYCLCLMNSERFDDIEALFMSNQYSNFNPN